MAFLYNFKAVANCVSFRYNLFEGRHSANTCNFAKDLQMERQ